MKRLVAVLLVCSSCVTIGEDFRRKGLARASFDLGCSSDEIQFWLLNRAPDDPLTSRAIGAQVGVAGCDKKTVYVLSGDPDSRWSWTWLANREVLSR